MIGGMSLSSKAFSQRAEIKHVGGVESTEYVSFLQYPLFAFHDAATAFNSAINAVIYRNVLFVNG